MENKTSPPHSSCISPAPAAMSAGESSWAMHIAEFLTSSSGRQEMGRQGAGGSESSFSSSFNSLGNEEEEDDSFITSDLMDEDDEDESLQDTACSSAAGPKQVTSMYDMWMKSIVTMDAKDMNTQLAKYFLHAGSRQQATAGGNNNEKQLYECSDLRKKGLCLVPLSMLIDYLG